MLPFSSFFLSFSSVLLLEWYRSLIPTRCFLRGFWWLSSYHGSALADNIAFTPELMAISSSRLARENVKGCRIGGRNLGARKGSQDLDVHGKEIGMEWNGKGVDWRKMLAGPSSPILLLAQQRNSQRRRAQVTTKEFDSSLVWVVFVK